MTVRRYAMTKVGAGDYLLPSNDGLTLWRLQRYTEDGSLQQRIGDEWTPVKGTRFWRLLRLTTRMDLLSIVDPDDETSWVEVESLLRSRTDAIEAALGGVR